MELTRPVAVTHVSLDTDATAVVAPADFRAVICGARSGGTWVEWQRQPASDSANAATCLDSKESIKTLRGPSGRTIFYAKVASGTADLEVEWWG